MTKYAGIIYDDIANGTGIGAALFFQGCPHHCPGCHNPSTWDFDAGQKITTETVSDLMYYFQENPFATRLSISGGEPLTTINENHISMYKISGVFKNRLPNHKIWLWTGYCFEDLTDEQKYCLQRVDVLVDGPFIEGQKDLTLAFRGSKNQRILDCQASLKANKPILHKEFNK